MNLMRNEEYSSIYYSFQTRENDRSVWKLPCISIKQSIRLVIHVALVLDDKFDVA